MNIGKAKAAASPGAGVVPNQAENHRSDGAILVRDRNAVDGVRAAAGQGRPVRGDQILVRDGKGAKDRVTMLPASVKAGLETHLERVKFVKRGT